MPSIIKKTGSRKKDAYRKKAFIKKSSIKNSEKLIQPYPFSTADSLKRMLDKFEKNGRAQNISFRKLVHWIKVGERATHYLHRYPAKMLPQIAHFFLAAPSLTQANDIVLDPFGGTGTVALETILSGKSPLYSEVNPLAQLIARSKTEPLKDKKLTEAFKRIKIRFANRKRGYTPSPPSVVNIDYWYPKKTIQGLCHIKEAILSEKNRKIRDFFLTSFSGTCTKVSRADPRLSVPVLEKNHAIDNMTVAKVWDKFKDQVTSNFERMKKYNVLLGKKAHQKLALAGNDAKKLNAPNKKGRLKAGCVSLIITSPPYAGAQKYIRASSLNLGWLGLAKKNELKPLENASIGREHFMRQSYVVCPSTKISTANKLIKKVFLKNPLRSIIISTYLNEMDAALKEMARVLKPGGHLVLVIGNNIVCGMPFKSSEYLLEICKRHGLTLRLKLIDEIKSRGLMTKRNKTASVITREWVLLMQKPKIQKKPTKKN